MFLIPFFGGVDSNAPMYDEEYTSRTNLDYDSDSDEYSEFETEPAYQDAAIYVNNKHDTDVDNVRDSFYSREILSVEGGFDLFPYGEGIYISDSDSTSDFDAKSNSNYVIELETGSSTESDDESDLESDNIQIKEIVESPNKEKNKKKGGNESDTKHSGIDIYTGIDIAEDIDKEEQLKVGGDEIEIEDTGLKYFLIFTGANIARDLGHTAAT